jgi:hypothetical protein
MVVMVGLDERGRSEKPQDDASCASAKFTEPTNSGICPIAAQRRCADHGELPAACAVE